MMFKKLRNKLLILNLTVTAIVMLAAFCATYMITYRNIQSENQRKLSSLAATQMTYSSTSGVQDESMQPGDSENSWFATYYQVDPDYSTSFVVTVDEQGAVLRISSIIDLSQESYQEAARLAWNNKNGGTAVLFGREWMYTVTPMEVVEIIENGVSVKTGLENSFNITFLDITDSLVTIRNLMVTFAWVSAVTLGIIVLVSLYFANRAIKPIVTAWNKQRQFVADASHELKTPLSVITANYDAILSNENETVKSQKEWFEYMKIGTDRMTKLINGLLSLTKMENIDSPIKKAPFNISKSIYECMHSMEAAAASKGLIVTAEMEPDIILDSDEEMVMQLFSILYDNAIKYSDSNGNIEVTLTKSRQRIICSVKNTGNYLSESELKKVFDRFYRSDESRSHETEGYGLGLPIAKTIADSLGGKIEAHSVKGGWTIFSFII